MHLTPDHALLSAIARAIPRVSGRRPADGQLAAALVVGMVLMVLALGWVDSWLGLPTFGLALVCGGACGWIAGPTRRESLVLALVPATILTNSAIIPYSGRYLPALTVLAAFLAAGRFNLGGLADATKRMPRPLIAVLVAYLAWMAVTTATSTSHVVSVAYLLGSVVTLCAVFLLVPGLPNLDRVAHHLLVTLTVAAVAIVISGLLLFAVGSVHIYGRTVGLYFLEEAVLFGHRTGIVFPQDYGPFLAPNTAPDAFGLVAALYLRAVSTRPAGRRLWTVAIVILVAGLVATFSREGWLIAAIGSLALFAAAARGRRPSLAPAVLGVALLVLSVGGLTNNVGVIGRMDLVRAWYGTSAPAILLNPNLDERGHSPSPTDPLSTDNANLNSVQLKGFSSLLARVSLWQAALAASEQRPLFGYGPGMDAVAIVPYLNGVNARLRGATTHSTFFRVLVEMGLPGLLIYLALVGLAAWYAIRPLWHGSYTASAVLAGTVLGLLASQFTGTLLLGGFSFPGFWLALAISLLAVVARVRSPAIGETRANTPDRLMEGV